MVAVKLKVKGHKSQAKKKPAAKRVFTPPALTRTKKKKQVKSRKKVTSQKSQVKGKGKGSSQRSKAKGKKKVVGRPNTYKRSFRDVATATMALGGGPSDIAKACKVSVATVYGWLKTRPTFLEAYEAGERQFEDDAEALYRKSCISAARPHDVVSVKVKEVAVTAIDSRDGAEIEVDVPAIETETTTKKGVFDVKPLANYVHRRRPDRYKEAREIGVSDEVQELADWLSGRNDSNSDNT